MNEPKAGGASVVAPAAAVPQGQRLGGDGVMSEKTPAVAAPGAAVPGGQATSPLSQSEREQRAAAAAAAAEQRQQKVRAAGDARHR